jgi:hypothetical protein
MLKVHSIEEQSSPNSDKVTLLVVVEGDTIGEVTGPEAKTAAWTKSAEKYTRGELGLTSVSGPYPIDARTGDVPTEERMRSLGRPENLADLRYRNTYTLVSLL